MPAGMDSWAPYLPGANLIKDRSTKCLGHPREAYGALREKKLLGRGSRPESYRYTWGNRALTGGVGARAARHGSSQLNLTSAISWVRDMVGLSSTETPKHPWVTAAGGGNANRGTGKFFRRSKAASRPPQWASQGGGQWSFNGKNTQSSCNVDGWANASIRYLHSACSKGPGLYWLLIRAWNFWEKVYYARRAPPP